MKNFPNRPYVKIVKISHLMSNSLDSYELKINISSSQIFVVFLDEEYFAQQESIEPVGEVKYTGFIKNIFKKRVYLPKLIKQIINKAFDEEGEYYFHSITKKERQMIWYSFVLNLLEDKK